MPDDPSHRTSLLAVYGTLRRGYRNWPLIVDGSVPEGPATLPGHLLHIASPLRRYPYPGYVPAPDDGPRAHQVVVELVRIDDVTLWPRLDALERYDPHDPDGSEYRRVLAVATTPTGSSVTCWTYRYDAPTNGYDVVPDGDWARLYPPVAPPS